MATSKKPTTHQVYNPNTKLLNINNGQKVRDVSTGKVYGPKNGLTSQQQAGRASLRAGTPVPQQVKSPTTHQVYKNGVLTVTPTQASKASTPEGQLAAKEGVFTNPHTGIQTDKYGNVVTGKNKYGVLQTTGTTAPSAMGTAGAATQSTAVRGTTTQGAVTPTVPTATTPVVDIGGGTTAGVSGTAGAATDSQRLADIAWKQHNGEPLSEEDFKYLVGQQLSGASSLAAQTQAAATAQETAAQDLIAKKQAEMEARASSQSKTTQGLVDQQKALLDEQAKAAIDQIKQNAMSEQTAGQNIMAFSGFGVSSAAIQKTQEIQAKYNAQSQAVVDAENLQLQMFQEQLQGADQAVLDEMQANIDTLQANADEMAYSNALDVAQANADANVDPLTALSNIMQVLPPAQAQQVNTDVSKMLGYLADESGNPITFANGETIPILTETTEAKNTRYLDELVKSGASPEIINALKVQLGLPDYTDPITQAQLAYDQANAKVKENEANGILTSPLDLIDLAQKTYDYYNEIGYTAGSIPTGGQYGATTYTLENGLPAIMVNVQQGQSLDLSETRDRDEGQCGAFVNDFFGERIMDNLFTQKMGLVDESIQVPEPGMAFVMETESKYGHTGIVEYVDPSRGVMGIVDANWNNDGEVRRTEIPISDAAGFVRAPNSISADASSFTPTDVSMVNNFLENGKVPSVYEGNEQELIDKANRLSSLATNPKTPLSQALSYTTGKKALTDTAVQSIQKNDLTAQQITDLATSFEDLDESDFGPLLGIISSANPYNTKAQDIRAQLQSIVPNLARGVYGEVGVLTDADIANYMKTLPNLTSTEDLRNAVLEMTQRTIGRSLESKLRAYAGTYDISGYQYIIDKYNLDNATAQEDLGALYDQSSDLSVSQNDLWDNL